MFVVTVNCKKIFVDRLNYNKGNVAALLTLRMCKVQDGKYKQHMIQLLPKSYCIFYSCKIISPGPASTLIWTDF